MRTRVSRAFTLVEILIVVVILGILAAIVIPQFTNASQEAQVGNVVTQLQTIRSQVELFRVRNNGSAPDLTAADSSGTYSTFGPFITPPAGQQSYMRTPPINPRNGLNTVSSDADPVAAAAAGDAVSLAVGWFYDPATGVIAAAGFDERPASATYGQWIAPATP